MAYHTCKIKKHQEYPDKSLSGFLQKPSVFCYWVGMIPIPIRVMLYRLVGQLVSHPLFWSCDQGQFNPWPWNPTETLSPKIRWFQVSLLVSRVCLKITSLHPLVDPTVGGLKSSLSCLGNPFLLVRCPFYSRDAYIIIKTKILTSSSCENIVHWIAMFLGQAIFESYMLHSIKSYPIPNVVILHVFSINLISYSFFQFIMFQPYFSIYST